MVGIQVFFNLHQIKTFSAQGYVVIWTVNTGKNIRKSHGMTCLTHVAADPITVSAIL